jgi:hypothetical protein
VFFEISFRAATLLFAPSLGHFVNSLPPPLIS